MEEKEFAAEVLPHRGYLMVNALHYCRQREDAEDLVQETYLRAFRFKEQYQLGTNARSWLHTILLRLAMDRTRIKAKKPDPLPYDEDIYEPPEPVRKRPPEEIFSDGIMDYDDSEFVALKSINEDQRKCILLYAGDYSYEEIAETLHIPINTVRTRLHRGRQKLQLLLKGYKP